MERHQKEQEETLVMVTVDMDSLGAVHRPRGSPANHPGCFKCVVALATVMGLIVVALAAVFILHISSCYKVAPTSSPPAKVNMTCNLKKSDEQGRYDIYTVDKAASYLIYGWVKFSDDTDKEATLKQTSKTDHRIIQKRKLKHDRNEKGILFFNATSMMASGVRISVHFESNYTDGLFHVYEL